MSDPVDPKLPDLRYIRELAKVFKQYELDELEIEAGDQRMLLRRADSAAPVVGMPAPVATVVATPGHAPAAAVAAASAPAVAAPAPTAEGGGDFITSPFVGTFYRSPRPDAPSFVDVGQRVQPGETVCIVEAMKLFNEIEADFACQIEECLIESGQPVEYGAKLFRVRKL
jgi:acetyl-CoA carboxylase biotin carboxyl carrier protein